MMFRTASKLNSPGMNIPVGIITNCPGAAVSLEYRSRAASFGGIFRSFFAPAYHGETSFERLFIPFRLSIDSRSYRAQVPFKSLVI